LDEWHFENDSVRIRKVEVGTFGNNAYVAACRKTEMAVIVDAAADPKRIISAAADTRPIAILTTHGHADHVGAAKEVAEELGVPIRLHTADWDLCPIQPDEPFNVGNFALGKAMLRIVHTPGHTPGSAVIITTGAVMTGDTLFPGGPGATRFPYSDFDQIMDSLDRELFTLPDATIVMPGHGLDTTIGTERPALGEWRMRRW
jgi:glyoxylase-like metal-dependent hydrolase (beta-lactamase superfamily II)